MKFKEKLEQMGACIVAADATTTAYARKQLVDIIRQRIVYEDLI